jgi:hypothetical protein
MVRIFLSLSVLLHLWVFVPTSASASSEPQVPTGVSWGMTIEQVQHLPELERTADGTLQNSYLIRGVSQDELVAQWKGRAVSLYIAKDYGLYAINIEMTPRAVQHTQNAPDQELLDLEQCAPIRLAVMQKYGAPIGIAATWDTQEIAPLPPSSHTTEDLEAEAQKWSYARNWLLWEGQESRLALGEQSLWYISRVGLAKREGMKLELEKERDKSLDRELDRRAKRQQQVDDARDAVTPRAQTFAAFF